MNQRYLSTKPHTHGQGESTSRHHAPPPREPALLPKQRISNDIFTLFFPFSPDAVSELIVCPSGTGYSFCPLRLGEIVYESILFCARHLLYWPLSVFLQSEMRNVCRPPRPFVSFNIPYWHWIRYWRYWYWPIPCIKAKFLSWATVPAGCGCRTPCGNLFLGLRPAC